MSRWFPGVFIDADCRGVDYFRASPAPLLSSWEPPDGVLHLGLLYKGELNVLYLVSLLIFQGTFQLLVQIPGSASVVLLGP